MISESWRTAGAITSSPSIANIHTHLSTCVVNNKHFANVAVLNLQIFTIADDTKCPHLLYNRK